MAALEFEEMLEVLGIGGAAEHADEDEHDHRRRRAADLNVVSGVGSKTERRNKRAADDHGHEHEAAEGTNISAVCLKSSHSAKKGLKSLRRQ